MPRGVIKYVLLQVHKFIYHMDFIVFDTQLVEHAIQFLLF